MAFCWRYRKKKAPLWKIVHSTQGPLGKLHPHLLRICEWKPETNKRTNDQWVFVSIKLQCLIHSVAIFGQFLTLVIELWRKQQRISTPRTNLAEADLDQSIRLIYLLSFFVIGLYAAPCMFKLCIYFLITGSIRWWKNHCSEAAKCREISARWVGVPRRGQNADEHPT